MPHSLHSGAEPPSTTTHVSTQVLARCSIAGDPPLLVNRGAWGVDRCQRLKVVNDNLVLVRLRSSSNRREAIAAIFKTRV
jgi:hypothetical protein